MRLVDFDSVVGQLERLDRDLGGAGFELRADPFDRVGVANLPAPEALAVRAIDRHPHIMADDLIVQRGVVPVAQVWAVGHAALERDIAPLDAARQPMDIPVLAALLVREHVEFALETAALAECRLDHATDLDGKELRRKRIFPLTCLSHSAPHSTCKLRTSRVA